MPQPPRNYSQRDAIEFLCDSASKILGSSSVATTTADKLGRDGIDAQRLIHLVLDRGKETTAGAFKFKLIDADPETPENFGVLVRKIAVPK